MRWGRDFVRGGIDFVTRTVNVVRNEGGKPVMASFTPALIASSLIGLPAAGVAGVFSHAGSSKVIEVANNSVCRPSNCGRLDDRTDWRIP